jgi:hypothetical protein
MPLSPKRDDSPAMHPHTVIDLTLPPLSPLGEPLSSGMKDSKVKVLQQTPKINLYRVLPSTQHQLPVLHIRAWEGYTTPNTLYACETYARVIIHILARLRRAHTCVAGSGA